MPSPLSCPTAGSAGEAAACWAGCQLQPSTPSERCSCCPCWCWLVPLPLARVFVFLLPDLDVEALDDAAADVTLALFGRAPLVRDCVYTTGTAYGLGSPLPALRWRCCWCC